MLLATILLLCPFPQIEGTAKAVTHDATSVMTETPSDAVSARAPARDSSLSQPLISAPEPKVKTDAEIASSAFIEPGYLPAQPPAPIKGVRMSLRRPTETAGQRKLWYALAITGSGAATFDAWSTRRAVSGGYGIEGNPLLRPFSHSGAMYAATQVSPLVMDFIGKRMMVSQHRWMRRMWWLPQSAGTGLSLYAGVHNVRMVP
jgi:hypothetical protein